MHRATAITVLVVLGIGWGTTIPLTKIAVSTGHHPIGLIFWQLAIATVVLGLISAARRRLPTVNRQTLLFFLVISLLGTLIPNSFSYLAAANLPAGVMAIMIATVPMFTLPTALVLGIERPSMVRLLGVLLGTVAVVVVIAPDTSLPDPQKAVFVLVALVASLCYGLESNYLTLRTPPNTDPVATLFGASLIGTAIAAPLALGTGVWVDLTSLRGPAEQALVINSILHALIYTAYVWLVARAGPVFTSQVAYVVTIWGVIFSAWLLGETYSVWVLSSLGLMIIGLTLVQPRNVRGVEPT